MTTDSLTFPIGIGLSDSIMLYATIISTIMSILSFYFGVVLPKRKQSKKQKFLEKNLPYYSTEEIREFIRFYVWPYCTTDYPEPEIQNINSIDKKYELRKEIYKWLNTRSIYHHLIIFSDTGLGKSSFLINYFAYNKSLPKRRQKEIEFVPMGMPDIDKKLEMIQDKSNKTLFLDALDEDPEANSSSQLRLNNLIEKCWEFNRVLITCRSQLFLKEEEIPRETPILRTGPRKAGESHRYEIQRLYLLPFTKDQIERFIKKRYPIWKFKERNKLRRLTQKIPLLSTRPMLLALIPEMIKKDLKIENNLKYSFQLYDIIVSGWLKRDSSMNERTALKEFSERLAIKLCIDRDLRGYDRIPAPELMKFENELKIEFKEIPIRGKSLLNRDSRGNYKFAHPSIMEYLFVKRFIVGDNKCKRIKWTDQMIRFIMEVIQYRLEEKIPIDFNIREAGIKGLTLSLREISIPNEENENTFLYEEGATEVLKSYNLFDIEKNKNGKGIKHLYDLKNIQSYNIVIDYATGLIWQQSGSLGQKRYDDIETYIEQLNREKYGGYTDWRLPTLEEAMSLLEPSKNGTLYVDTLFDPKQEYIWTSDKENYDQVWVVHLSYGGSIITSDTDYNYIRAVR